MGIKQLSIGEYEHSTAKKCSKSEARPAPQTLLRLSELLRNALTRGESEAGEQR